MVKQGCNGTLRNYLGTMKHCDITIQHLGQNRVLWWHHISLWWPWSTVIAWRCTVMRQWSTMMSECDTVMSKWTILWHNGALWWHTIFCGDRIEHCDVIMSHYYYKMKHLTYQFSAVWHSMHYCNEALHIKTHIRHWNCNDTKFKIVMSQ